MNIGINATGLSARKGGASFYIVNIINGLAEVDKENQYYIFATSIGKGILTRLPENFKVIDCAPLNVFMRLIWEQTILPLFLCQKFKIKTLFSPNYTAPVLKLGFKSVVTIFDLSFFPLSYLYPLQRRLFKPIIWLSVLLSDNIIAISEFTKKDILKYIGNYEKKIRVIHCAADARFEHTPSRDEASRIKTKYNLQNDYILFIGFLEPRKNLLRLLEAFSLIQSTIKENLVIVGGNGWWCEPTYKKVQELHLEQRVIFAGYAPNEDLPGLYAGAKLFAFPSLYEGFGIAALESISCGTPALISNNTSLPEVVGEAGIYVDPYSISDIKEKLFLSLTNHIHLEKMKSCCLEQSKKFSWHKAAYETVDTLVTA